MTPRQVAVVATCFGALAIAARVVSWTAIGVFVGACAGIALAALAIDIMEKREIKRCERPPA